MRNRFALILARNEKIAAPAGVQGRDSNRRAPGPFPRPVS